VVTKLELQETYGGYKVFRNRCGLLATRLVYIQQVTGSNSIGRFSYTCLDLLYYFKNYFFKTTLLPSPVALNIRFINIFTFVSGAFNGIFQQQRLYRIELDLKKKMVVVYLN
jgi:hypothetical protein